MFHRNPGTATTHSNWGDGSPRLLVHGDGIHDEIPLTHTVTHIGSAGDSEIQFDFLAPTHAIVHHDAVDEYELTLYGPGETTQNPDPDDTGLAHPIILRTGAQFRLGPLTFVFQREEFADHGRPYGGRQGGELSPQLPQPRRPDYLAGETADTPRPEEPPID